MIYNENLTAIADFDILDFSINNDEEYNDYSSYKNRIRCEGASSKRFNCFGNLTLMDFVISAQLMSFFLTVMLHSAIRWYHKPVYPLITICATTLSFLFYCTYRIIKEYCMFKVTKQFSEAFNDNDSDIRIEWERQKEAYNSKNKNNIV